MYRVRGVSGVRRGLGDLTSDCASVSSIGWLFNPQCWSYSPSTWAALQTRYPAPPAPAPPGVPAIGAVQSPGTLAPSSGAAAQQDVNSAIDQGAAATRAQNLNFFQGLTVNSACDPNVDANCSTGLSTTALIAIGLAAGVGLLLVTSGGGRRRR